MLVSLPRKWAIKYGVKKGDEVEIEEDGNKLNITTQKGLVLKKAEIDISGLDRTSVLFYIRALYRSGYDEIKVKFNEPYTMHIRIGEKKKVITVIHDVINRLIGFEIIQHKEDYCIIKDISEISAKDFDNVLQRIFVLLLDINKDLLSGVKSDNRQLIETIEEKHDNIMKFVGYSLRILNKKGYSDTRKINTLYHIVSVLDKLVDVFKDAARYIIVSDMRISKECKPFLDQIHNSIVIFNDYFFNFDIKKVQQMYKNRDSILKDIRKNLNKLPQSDINYLIHMTNLLEYISDIADHRISMEY